MGRRCLEQKSHLVRWAIVRLDKQQGGLGIRDLIILNETLLGKWFWRFASERDPLWKRVIVGKYGQVEGGLCSKVVREGHGVGGRLSEVDGRCSKQELGLQLGLEIG